MTKIWALWALAATVVGVVQGQSPTITAPSTVETPTENEYDIFGGYPYETTTKV